MDWRPATVAEVKAVLEKDLPKCDDLQLATFRRYAVEPHFASIVRYGEVGTVVVVAEKAGYAVYWEDVEEGFNVSQMGPDGSILEPGFEQNELGHALNHWIEGRTTTGARRGPR